MDWSSLVVLISAQGQRDLGVHRVCRIDYLPFYMFSCSAYITTIIICQIEATASPTMSEKSTSAPASTPCDLALILRPQKQSSQRKPVT